MKQIRTAGFTLAELLIALAILGIIATFTIPKVLNATANSQNTAIAKEAASMISGAFSSYTLVNTLTSGTTPGMFTSYMNFVQVDTASTSTNIAPGMVDCAAGIPCLRLHNGGIVQYSTTATFAGTNSTNAVYFNVDPDGTGGQTKATFVQYYNGRFSTGGRADAATASTTGGVASVTTDPTYIQSWN